MIRITKTAAVAAILTAVLLVSAGCSGSGSVTAVGNEELRELQSAGARVVDCRTPGEFASGRIPGAENVPVDTIAQAAEGWDRSVPVVVYCAVGSRSAQAAATLSGMGFENVYDLTAGIARWDGEFEGGQAATPDGSPPEPASELPVMYEFFTES